MPKKPRDYIYNVTYKGAHIGNAPTKIMAEGIERGLMKTFNNVGKDDIKITKQYNPAIKKYF